jgi:hypothetical protein
LLSKPAIKDLGDFVDRIYPIWIEIKDITDTDRSASYLDLHLETESEGRFIAKLYDKRDTFNCYLIEVCLVRIKEQVGERRSTVCTHLYVDCLLKTRPPSKTESEGRFIAKLYDKRDTFNCYLIFLFICSNIPAAPAYGVYVSQLI